MKKLGAQKAALLAAIAVTALFPLAYVRLDEPTGALNLVKLLAKTGSLVGTFFLLWQLLLGFRNFVPRIIPDLIWVTDVHKWLGRYGTLLVLLHPIFITVYYSSRHGVGLWAFRKPPEFQPAAFNFFFSMGILALVVLLAVAATSVFWRERLGEDRWYGLHLTSYFVLPLVLLHSYPIGMTIGQTGLRLWWQALIVAAFALYVARGLGRLGLLGRRYEVVRARQVARDVTEIFVRPLSCRVEPEVGQFVFFRRNLRTGVNPYTVSHYDEKTGEISVTVKAAGRLSSSLQSIRPGERVTIEGPFGVFARQALAADRQVVMIAGGIGITAFKRLIDLLARRPGKDDYLFYGSRKLEDIVWREELDSLDHVRVVHVLNEEPDYEGEKGFVTADILKRHLGKDLTGYDFLICGPPVMIKKVEEALLAEGVPDRQIDHELFGL